MKKLLVVMLLMAAVMEGSLSKAEAGSVVEILDDVCGWWQ